MLKVTSAAHAYIIYVYNLGNDGELVDPISPAAALKLVDKGDLRAVQQEDYCPVTFDGSVPETLTPNNPVVTDPSGVTFVYGDDGMNGHYYKFVKNGVAA